MVYKYLSKCIVVIHGLNDDFLPYLAVVEYLTLNTESQTSILFTLMMQQLFSKLDYVKHSRRDYVM